jgi:hypothetical protein
MAKIVKSIRKVKTERVYDITVENSHHYILDNNIITHNSGLKYAASQIIYLSKKKEKDGTEIVGNIIKAKVVKSRLSKENQTAEIRLFYDNRGIDKYYGILELGIEAGLITQGGAWYTFVDTGEKVQKKKILENVDEYFNEEFLTKLNTYVKEKFSYGF